MPIIDHVMYALARDRNLDDRKVTSEISSQVLPLIQDLPQPEEREFYTQKLARFLRIDERAFLSGSRGGPGATRRRRTSPAGTSGPKPILEAPPVTNARRRVETHVLAWLFRRPELIYRVEEGARRLVGKIVIEGNRIQAVGPRSSTPVPPGARTVDVSGQVVFNLIRRSVEQDAIDAHAYVVQSMPDSLKGLLQELLSMTENAEGGQPGVRADPRLGGPPRGDRAVGGSVNAATIDELMAQSEIDRVLVGGASLVPQCFARIANYQVPVAA